MCFGVFDSLADAAGYKVSATGQQPPSPALPAEGREEEFGMCRFWHSTLVSRHSTSSSSAPRDPCPAVAARLHSHADDLGQGQLQR